MLKARQLIVLGIGFASSVALCGCVTTVQKQTVGHDSAVTVNVPHGKGGVDTIDSSGNLTLDEALGTDESAQRLEKIIAAMLLYYSQNNHMPPQLGDLRVLDAGLPLENPGNLPYIYHPNGLRSSASPDLILVNDPTPTSNGHRWCIVEISGGKGTAAQLEAEAIPEKLFGGYQPRPG